MTLSWESSMSRNLTEPQRSDLEAQYVTDLKIEENFLSILYTYCAAKSTFYFAFSYVVRESNTLNFIYLFIYLCLAALGLHFCARAFSSCSEQGLLFAGVWASHCCGFSCCGTQAIGTQVQ